ncbi:acyltransferase [Phocaeicola sp. HCN-40430]|uniref:acyltransferase n=1 Tax=Phocaeicola sp. HCN-40430 TaxID=3134664 RepID=UPI0030BC2BB4
MLNKLFHHNWIAIIYFNFKMLPFHQAIYLPFDFRHKVRFECLKGKIIINPNIKLRRGIIAIGGRGSEMFPHNPTIINFRKGGKIYLNGITEIGVGSYLYIGENGTLTLGNKVRIGAFSKLYCNKRITIGDEVGISWESQIFDTNFHFMENIENKQILEKDTPIIIGSYNWFGNRVNIMKGTKTPDHCIIASNSLCNKDYTNFPLYSLIAGSPAKFIKQGVRRLFEGVDL